MSRYNNSNETTREDRQAYAEKWVSNYFKVKELIAEHKFTKESQVVDHLVNEWEAKANSKEDRSL